jgi:hypothetical protein
MDPVAGHVNSPYLATTYGAHAINTESRLFARHTKRDQCRQSSRANDCASRMDFRPVRWHWHKLLPAKPGLLAIAMQQMAVPENEDPIIPFAPGYDLRFTQSHRARPEVLVFDNTFHVMRAVTIKRWQLASQKNGPRCSTLLGRDHPQSKRDRARLMPRHRVGEVDMTIAACGRS